jgi:hypothetical protein
VAGKCVSLAKLKARPTHVLPSSRLEPCRLHVCVAASPRGATMPAMVATVMATMMTPVMSHACGRSRGAIAVLRKRDAAQAERKYERQH